MGVNLETVTLPVDRSEIFLLDDDPVEGSEFWGLMAEDVGLQPMGLGLPEQIVVRYEDARVAILFYYEDNNGRDVADYVSPSGAVRLRVMWPKEMEMKETKIVLPDSIYEVQFGDAASPGERRIFYTLAAAEDYVENIDVEWLYADIYEIRLEISDESRMEPRLIQAYEAGTDHPAWGSRWERIT